LEHNAEPKIRARYERSLKTEFPTSEYKPLRVALLKEDYETAKAAYLELLETRTPATIAHAMAPHTGGRTNPQTGTYTTARAKPFTGSSELKAAFRRTLNPVQVKLYNRALEERKEQYKRFLKVVRDVKRAKVA
jgi:hypothetical protein